MKVTFLPYKAYSNNINFRSSASMTPPRNDNNKEYENKPLPEWARKTMLATVVLMTLKNEPVVQNIFRSNDLSQEKLDRIEFYHDVQKVRKDKGVSTAFYHLNKLGDIEQPKIKKIDDSSYSLEFNLDKNKVNLELTLNENAKDTIQGRVKIGNNNYLNYKAIFPSEKKDEFKILLQDKKANKKMIFGRDYDGGLYRVEGNKKVTVNSKNVEKYEQYLESIELYDDFRFFTVENPLWRNLNYILLICLLFNEMAHDKMRRKNKQNSEDKNNKV